MSDDIKELTKLLADKGKLIEAGWVSYLHLVVPKTAGSVQIEETRRGFYAGSQHLFASIMQVLEDGAEATETDMKRLDNIQAELDEFVRSL